jgi:2'-5' RNA ligase
MLLYALFAGALRRRMMSDRLLIGGIIGVMESYRLFIAVPLPPVVIDAVAAVQTELQRELPVGAVRWVKPANVHLTLRFLGETPIGSVDAVAAACHAAAAGCAATRATPTFVGGFPNLRRPRVIWAGLRAEPDTLASTKAALDGALQPLGWPPDKQAFKPHLTLGRVKDARRLGGQVVPRLSLPALTFAIDSVQLIRSQLRPTGPLYTVVTTARLGR